MARLLQLGEHAEDELEVLGLLLASVLVVGPQAQVLHHGHLGEQMALLGDEHHPHLHQLVRRQTLYLLPSKRMIPLAGFMRPQMVLSRVLLPWPLGPKIDTNVPLGHLQRDVVDGLVLAVEGVDVLDLKHA